MRHTPSLLVVAALLSLSACEVIGGIFKAGVWVGIVLVVLVLAGLFWIVGKLRR
ncbi:MAG TPA: hypothetical protein VFV75_18550 [Candidatus Polarisedimenticolaceae bacterium]|nr:hypothetical protein [Candidatus Polarisedimenticolaceae bacterium]